MKAIQVEAFGGPEVLHIQEVEVPKLADDEVLIVLYAAGVNPVETYIRQGGYGKKNPELPYTPGSDGAGVVEKVGKHVTHLKEGDRVCVSGSLTRNQTGTYAEKVVCSANAVYPLPDELSFYQGAGLGVPALAAYRALFLKAKIHPKETVLIHGASGAVGLLAVQMAKNAGAVVIGTAGSKDGQERVYEHGADLVLNHHEPGYLDQLAEMDTFKEVDVVIEMLANVNLERDLNHLRRGGRIVIVGSKGSLEFHPRLIMEKEAQVIGMAIAQATESEQIESMEGILDFVHTQNVRPYIGKVFPLDGASAAHQEVERGTSNGLVVLDIHSY